MSASRDGGRLHIGYPIWQGGWDPVLGISSQGKACSKKARTFKPNYDLERKGDYALCFERVSNKTQPAASKVPTSSHNAGCFFFF